jgi:flavin-dependent dehydrogenase
MNPPYDVLILGAGLAGLSLARQLLLAEPGLRVLVADRRSELPPADQKVGEATVQVSGYYFSRVLDLEEHLLREHYLKYNLRFHWKTGAADDRGDRGDRYEGYSQSYIRALSNVASYQLDRNLLEAELIRRNLEAPGFELHAGAEGIDLELDGDGPHPFRFRTPAGEVAGRARWVVDATGRARLLAKRLGLGRKSPIRHGSSYLWIEGLLDVERLTDLSPREIRLRPDRSALGHLPAFLATNHFCGEGFWFWVIPLHGKTSLGLVYDASKIDRREVSTPEKLIDWIGRQFPLFARDLPGRDVLHFSGFADFAHDAGQTISPSGWALTGEACRFSDPLYSPGGDLIAIYNTLIADAVLTRDQASLERKVRLYESLARAVYDAYLPSYAVSYETLGDQEAFSLRYVWELTVYFGFYVFPFVNDLFTDPGFLPGYLRRFARLGPINHGLHAFLAGYYRWKKENVGLGTGEPVFFDFMESCALRGAEACFYKVGLSSEEARKVLDEQLADLEELARWIVAHVAAVVLDDPRAATRADFVRGIDVDNLAFDPDALAARLAACPRTGEAYAWKFAPPRPDRFRPEPPAAAPEKAVAAGAVGGVR